MNYVLLFQIEKVYSGTILKRPSQYCKSPYVADVLLDNNEIIAHSPSLGCCGLAEKDSNVIMSKIEKKSKQKSVCEYKIELAIHKEKDEEMIIGINPKLGETIAEHALNKNCICGLTNIKTYQREIKVLNSRFDFAGIDSEGVHFIMEIKNVPLADYIDVPKKERKKYINSIINKSFNEKISYFPDGYRKNSTDVVSPRALKHIQELEKIAKEKKIRTILCFIIQRTDVTHFQTSNVDLTYKEAVYNAYQNGVEIKTIQVSWNKSGECYFIRNDLPIKLEIEN